MNITLKLSVPEEEAFGDTFITLLKDMSYTDIKEMIDRWRFTIEEGGQIDRLMKQKIAEEMDNYEPDFQQIQFDAERERFNDVYQ